jgi:hypothetical protein
VEQTLWDDYDWATEEEETQEGFVVEQPKDDSLTMKKESLEVQQQQEKAEKESNKPLRMVHVWSPYVVRHRGKTADDGNDNDDDNPFAPLDQAQNVTWESMYRSQQDYILHSSHDGSSLTIYCAVLWMDVEILQRHNPPLCRPEHILVLNRSTHTEYPNVSPPIHYPFLQDILQLIPNTNDYDYLIFTNSDISVITYFYSLVATTIATQKRDAFTVNRVTIPKEYNNETLHSGHLSLIETQLLKEVGEPHPGVDCFIMHKEIIQSIQLGHMFLGHPPWARMLMNILMTHMAFRYRTFESSYGWTYHLGNDKDWKNSTKNDRRNLTLAEQAVVQVCPWNNDPPDHLYTDHWLQNSCNCAEVSLGLSESIRNATLPPPPLFVTPHGAERYYQTRNRNSARTVPRGGVKMSSSSNRNGARFLGSAGTADDRVRLGATV